MAFLEISDFDYWPNKDCDVYANCQKIGNNYAHYHETFLFSGSAVAASTSGTVTSGTASGTKGTNAASAALQSYFESANRDSHPIASDELVERLEEISTQQGSPDAAEDPER